MAGRRKASAAVVQSQGDGWLTRALVDDLVRAIAVEHLPKRWAALRCGVSPETFATALQEGASGSGGPLSVELARRVYEAMAKNVGEQMGYLHRLSEEDPRACEQYLKATQPEDFGGHVRTAPDEFASPERQKKTRGMLLDNPPPRMLAEFKAHDWFRLPKGISVADRETILGILSSYDKPPALLTAGEAETEAGTGAGPHE